MDTNRLKTLRDASPIAAQVLDAVATQDPDSNWTTVDEVESELQEQNPEVTRLEILTVFKQLAAADFGEYVVGRRGYPTRFVWRIPMSELHRTKASGAFEKESYLKSADSSESLEHSFNLRANLVIHFRLPVDISKSEASRLADFINTLPFK